MKCKKKPQRRCVVCPKRKETRFICETCDVGLCAVLCFKNYQTMKKYCILTAFTILIQCIFSIYMYFLFAIFILKLLPKG